MKYNFGEIMRSLYYAEVNAICIVVIGILLFGIRNSRKNIRDELYRVLLIVTMIFCSCDLVAGVLRGTSYSFSLPVLWVSNVTFFVASLVMSEIWLVYSMYILTGQVNKNAVVMTSSVVLIGCVFFVSAPWNGLAFTINEQNLYSRGPLMWIQYAITVPYMILPSCVAPFTKAEYREKRAVAAFALFPLVTSLVQVLFYGTSICQVGLTAAILMLYVLYQSEIVNEAEAKAKLLDEISNTDFLTQLKNRRAYELRIVDLESEKWIGAAFADLNGLKRENDLNGHKSGDKMLCRFAALLKTYFSEEEIFRISGDEFVILSTDKENFETKYDDLLNHSYELASIGACEGNGAAIDLIISNAEREMYQKKDEYYTTTHKDRRKV